MSQLTAEGLTKQYRGRQVVGGVSLHLDKGEIVGLLGPNGAGKTTCFYMLAGLVPVDAGRVRLAGQDVTDKPMHVRAQCGLGYLAQEPSIFRQLSVVDNVLAVLETRSQLDKTQRQEICDQLLDEFNIRHLADNLGISLSGGERRRLEIARALAVEPDFILLDEPFAGVDAATEKAIISVLKSLRAAGKTVVVVHHDLATVTEYFDNVFLINTRSIAEGPVAQAFTEETLQAAYGGRLATSQIDQLAKV